MNYKKGSALFLVIIVLSVVLTIALGLGAITAIQFRTSGQVGNSVVAFYAADAGAERVLREAIKGSGGLQSTYPDNDELGDAAYSVSLVCCTIGAPTCALTVPTDCPSPLVQNADCKAERYCITSTGMYKAAKRTVEVNI